MEAIIILLAEQNLSDNFGRGPYNMYKEHFCEINLNLDQMLFEIFLISSKMLLAKRYGREH